MPDTATLRPRSPDRSKLHFQWWWVPLAIVAIAIVVFLPRVFAGPATIDKLTIVNHTNYALDLRVSNGHDNGWTDLATAERGRTTVINDVVDQGKTWVFGIESQGVDGGNLEFSKADLERAGWKVDIPDSLNASFAEKGAPPTPPPGF